MSAMPSARQLRVFHQTMHRPAASAAAAMSALLAGQGKAVPPRQEVAWSSPFAARAYPDYAQQSTSFVVYRSHFKVKTSDTDQSNFIFRRMKKRLEPGAVFAYKELCCP
jgi:hypothetical protein